MAPYAGTHRANQEHDVAGCVSHVGKKLDARTIDRKHTLMWGIPWSRAMSPGTRLAPPGHIPLIRMYMRITHITNMMHARMLIEH